MDENAKTGKRLGLVAMALASLSAPMVVPDPAVAAGPGDGGGRLATPQTGSSNTIIYGVDGRAHKQTIILGMDGKPQNNRMVVGRDGKYHDTTGAGGIIINGNAAHPTNNHTAYRRPEEK